MKNAKGTNNYSSKPSKLIYRHCNFFQQTMYYWRVEYSGFKLVFKLPKASRPIPEVSVFCHVVLIDRGRTSKLKQKAAPLCFRTAWSNCIWPTGHFM